MRVICLVTDRQRLWPDTSGSASIEALVDFAGTAARAGVDMIQIRERDLSGKDLASLVERALRQAVGTSCRIVVNDRTDVALATRADGVHLRADSVGTPAVRRVAPTGFAVGRSIHSAAEAAGAADDGTDYLILGTIFPSASKPDSHACAGVEGIARASASVAVPILAIGGMTLERAGQAVKAGAAGIAAIGLFVPPRGTPAASHLDSVVGNLRRLFDTC